MKTVRGQLFVEILVGIGIITTTLVASLVLVTYAARLARTTRNRLEAAKYAEKAIEILRSTRDTDKESFFRNEVCNPSCGTFGSNTIYSCALECTFSPPTAATQMEVRVTISWDDAGVNFSLPLATVLTKYDL